MIAVDIYFDENYGKLYEEIEGGKQEVFDFSCEHGSVRHQFIKRPIDGQWFDLITPYGYGGPVIINANNKEALVQAFEKAFEGYCAQNHIVSEFVRFHPVENNAEDFQSVYKCENIRYTVGTNLKDYDDPIQEEFTKQCRKNIRQILKKGVSYRITERPEDLSKFTEIYYATMERNAATDFYFFPQEYFDRCISAFRDRLLLIEALWEEDVIAAGLYLLGDKTVHIHLTGTREEFLYLSPEYILRYAVTLWAKDHGYEWIHNGGGRSNSEDDPLYKFKKQFGKNTQFDFYIGKKIWNKEMYGRLCQDNNISPDVSFFPAYRSK